MKKIMLTTSGCILSTLLCIAPVHAEKHLQPDTAPNKIDMTKIMELSSPGEHHKILDQLVGDWNYTINFKMSPDAPAQTSKGTSIHKWILGGRFIQQNVQGSMDINGQSHKFEGLGYISHDNLKGQYKSIWMDNMGTGTMVGHGSYDKANKTLTETGQYSCAMRGGQIDFKSELRFIDADNYHLTIYDTHTDGRTYKSMDIQYHRQ